MQICVIIFYRLFFIIINKRSIQFCLLFLDLHLQISLLKVTLFWSFFCLKRLSLISLFHFTKRWVLISILFVAFFLSLSISLIWIKGNPCVISQNYLSVFLSLFLFLSRKVSLLLHLMQIYGRFRPCFTWN